MSGGMSHRTFCWGAGSPPAGADWAARKITRVIFLAPDDTEVKVAERDVGWVLDRTRFDAHLAAQASAAGSCPLGEDRYICPRP